MAGRRFRPVRALAGWIGRRFGPAPKMSATSYAAAVHNRLYNWIKAPMKSADSELQNEYETLKARGRDMGKNDPYGVRFVGLVGENVLGPHGIRLQATVQEPDGSPDTRTNHAIEGGWKEWGKHETCTADGRLCWAEAEDLFVETWVQDGEAIVRLLPGFDNGWGFAIQHLDTDQLDSTFNRPRGRGTNEIRMSVEIDAWGRAVAYHLWSSHPNDYQGGRGRVRERIPAHQIIHQFKTRRAGQTRGVTWFAAIILAAQMREGYTEAELVAARTAASKMGFLNMDPEVWRDPDSPTANKPLTMNAEPGVIEAVVGTEFQAWDPTHPTTAFDPFTKAILRSHAAGLKTSYASLTGDLSQVNYSSIRWGGLQERDVWKKLQGVVAEHFHERVYSEWLRWALIMGRLDVPSRDLRAVNSHGWMGRGWPWIDPWKELKAAELALALKLDSRTRLAATQGRDLVEVFEDIVRERKLADEHGIELDDDDGDPPLPTGGRLSREELVGADPGVFFDFGNGNGTGSG